MKSTIYPVGVFARRLIIALAAKAPPGSLLVADYNHRYPCPDAAHALHHARGNKVSEVWFHNGDPEKYVAWFSFNWALVEQGQLFDCHFADWDTADAIMGATLAATPDTDDVCLAPWRMVYERPTGRPGRG